jgi:type I restriction-modification system DNA methylase subunit
VKNNYNERSWAIDVITQINLIVSQRKKVIRKAGGERTLKASTKSSSLFPDVLLFQDEQSARVLQGWELKMPDTPITDAELLINAEKKARLLGLNSFLVWNVSEAALYVLNAGKYEHRAQWSDLKDITKRDEVEANEGRWVAQLTQIIEDLEQFFNNGDIKSQNILEALSENKIIDVITGNIGLVKQNIISALQKDAHLDALVTEWWETIKIEYSSEPDAPSAVAKLVLMTWVNRFLFAHYLKKFTDKALQIDDFNEGTTLADAKVYFSELTAESDFLNVYAPVIGEDLIDAVSWEQILQLNLFLSELNLKDIDQGLLQQFFEQLLLTSKRKAAGQYATPYSLADYFTRIVVLDKTLPMIDPFCGTGTILRAVYDLKVEAGVSPLDTISSIWGSDKFSFPLQMSTISLAKPEVMGQVLNIFKSDVIDLEIAKSYDFIDPNNGNTVTKQLPGFDYIISNLPFVKGADIGKANPNIFGIIKKIANLLTEPNFAIPAKSDLIAYLPYYLWHLCNDKGRVGLIVSNSWLGTDWGEQFRTRLNRFFKIEKIVTSGNGKWFQNAAVVTNLIVLEKRAVPIAIAADEEETSFITMNVSVDELADKATVQKAARETILRRNGLVKVRSWT